MRSVLWPVYLVEMPGSGGLPGLEAGSREAQEGGEAVRTLRILPGDPVSLPPSGKAIGDLAPLVVPLGSAPKAAQLQGVALAVVAVVVPEGPPARPGAGGGSRGGEGDPGQSLRDALIRRLQLRIHEAGTRPPRDPEPPREGAGGNPGPGLPGATLPRSGGSGVPGLSDFLALLAGGTPGGGPPPEGNGFGEEGKGPESGAPSSGSPKLLSPLAELLGPLVDSEIPLHSAIFQDTGPGTTPGRGDPEKDPAPPTGSPGGGVLEGAAAMARGRAELFQTLGLSLPGALADWPGMPGVRPKDPAAPTKPPAQPPGDGGSGPQLSGVLSGVALLGPGELVRALAREARSHRDPPLPGGGPEAARLTLEFKLRGDPGSRGSGVLQAVVGLRPSFRGRPGLAAELPAGAPPGPPSGRPVQQPPIPLLVAAGRTSGPPLWLEIGDLRGPRPSPFPEAPADGVISSGPTTPPILHLTSPGGPVVGAWIEAGILRLVRFRAGGGGPGRPSAGGHTLQAVKLPEHPPLRGPVALASDAGGRLVAAALGESGRWILLREGGAQGGDGGWTVTEASGLPAIAPGYQGPAVLVRDSSQASRPGQAPRPGMAEPSHPDIFWVPATDPGKPAPVHRDHAATDGRGGARWGRTTVGTDREGLLDAARGFGLGASRGPSSNPVQAALVAAVSGDGSLGLASAVLSQDPPSWIRVPAGPLDPRHPGPRPLRIAGAPAVAVAPDGSGVAIALVAEDGALHLVAGGSAASPAPEAHALGQGLTLETVHRPSERKAVSRPSDPALVLDGPLAPATPPPLSRAPSSPPLGRPTVAWTDEAGNLHLARRDDQGAWSHRTVAPETGAETP